MPNGFHVFIFSQKHSITLNYNIDVDEDMTRLHSPGQTELQIVAHRLSNASNWSLNKRKGIIIETSESTCKAP